MLRGKMKLLMIELVKCKSYVEVWTMKLYSALLQRTRLSTVRLITDTNILNWFQLSFFVITFHNFRFGILRSGYDWLRIFDRRVEDTFHLNAESPGGEPIQVSEAANPQLKQNN